MTDPATRLDPSSAPDNAALLRDVRAGLTSTPRQIPSKYFYDQRGSELFEEITCLPEYYLTRAERGLLEKHADEMIESLRPASLVELGAGSAAKTRILLEAMMHARGNATYVPIDVSESFLEETAARLRKRYRNLDVVPVVADLSDSLDVPRLLPTPVLFAFLGSTIGNFSEQEALELLSELRGAMRRSDRLLLGVDLVKDVERLHRAYNDSAGVTAEFNRNVLHVLNRELGATFDPDAFEHLAFYDAEKRRIEMHLVASRPMRVEIPGLGTVGFRSGERLRTEISCKYDRESVSSLLERADLSLERWVADDDFALLLAAPGAGRSS